MPRFYWRLVKRTPTLLWRSLTILDKVVGALTLALGAFGLVGAWRQLVPWWLPFGAVLFYGFLKENYEAFREIEKERDGLARRSPNNEKRKAIRKPLGEAQAHGQYLERQYHFEDEGVTHEDLSRWIDNTYDLIKDAFGTQEAETFTDNHGVPLNKDGYLAGFNLYHDRNNMEARFWRLQRLGRDAHKLPIEEDFDPKKWEGCFRLESA